MSVKLSKKSNALNIGLVRPLSVGGASYLVGMLVDNQTQANLFGYNLSMPQLYALLGFLSSLGTGPITDLAMSHLNARYQNLSKEMVSAGVHVGSNVGVIYALSGELKADSALVALGGHVLGEYIDQIVSPLFGAQKV